MDPCQDGGAGVLTCVFSACLKVGPTPRFPSLTPPKHGFIPNQWWDCPLRVSLPQMTGRRMAQGRNKNKKTKL